MSGHGTLTGCEGPSLSLRLVEPVDAEYIHALRTNPAYNQHLSAVTGSAADQRRWIEDYKQREAAGQEFYYVIARKDGLPCGLVRLYDITPESFTWGSWILDSNKPRKAAFESAVLSFGMGFEGLGLQRANVDVREDNTHARNFYLRFGMKEVGKADGNVSLVCSKEQYQIARNQLMTVIAASKDLVDG